MPGQGETILGSFGGTSTVATALNNLGQVAGTSTNSLDESYAFFWDPARGLRNLGSLDGVHSEGLGINDLGQVCGLALDSGWSQHAVIWNPDSTQTLLESPPGWVDARDLNESGTAIGHIGTRPVRWSGGGPPVELGHVIDLGWVHAINSAGASCGSSDLPNAQVFMEACLWGADGSFRPLGSWTDAGSDALDLNDGGDIVGWAGLIPYGPTSAVLWRAGGGMIDLNQFAPPGWLLLEARGINERGDITGVGRDSDGVQQAFVLWAADPAAVDGGPAGPRPGQAPAAPVSRGAAPSRLRIAPNPGPGPFRVQYEGPLQPGDTFRVFDVMGREVDAFRPAVSPEGRWSGRLSAGGADAMYVIVLQRGNRVLASGKALVRQP